MLASGRLHSAPRWNSSAPVWMAPARNGRPPRRASTVDADEWVVLPTRTRPRYLLPVRPTRIAGAVRLRASDRPLTRLAGTSLSLVLRSGVGSILPNRVSVVRGSSDHPSLLAWLQARLDHPRLSAAIGLGAPRPNRKPVLQLIDHRSMTVGFGKVGVDAHTNGLVNHEGPLPGGHRPLEPAARRSPPCPAPRRPGRDTPSWWSGTSARGLEASTDLHLTAKAIEAIAGLGPRDDHAVLDSPWWQRTGERIGQLTGPDRRLLERCHRVVGPKLGGQRWSFGTWHGDLAPWNARWRDGVLFVWDWERAGGLVPVGFDAVHAHFQVGLLRRRRQARGGGGCGGGGPLRDPGRPWRYAPNGRRRTRPGLPARAADPDGRGRRPGFARRGQLGGWRGGQRHHGRPR